MTNETAIKSKKDLKNSANSSAATTPKQNHRSFNGKQKDVQHKKHAKDHLQPMSNSDEARQSRKADRSVSPSKSADPNGSIGVGDKPLELERDQQKPTDKRQPSSFKDTNGRKAVAKEQPKQDTASTTTTNGHTSSHTSGHTKTDKSSGQEVSGRNGESKNTSAAIAHSKSTPQTKPIAFKRLQVADMLNQGYVCEHDAMHPDNEEYEWIRASLIHPEYFPAEGWAITMPVTPIPMPVTPVPSTQTSTKSNTIKAPLSYAQVATKAAAIPQPSSPAPVKAQTRSSATKSAPHTVTPRTATPSSSSTAPMKPTASPKSLSAEHAALYSGSRSSKSAAENDAKKRTSEDGYLSPTMLVSITVGLLAVGGFILLKSLRLK
ncbi:hypothetical protein QVD99_007283 [Batrachochytrium dendrobatidis]|nr:hypothetical protein O5D80_008555 [Batrachochytrium dendrobatidis]KAK5665634.1 hypothetical protein QVD99_007283 [Batrachochytrium dendrobatidis]